MTSAGRWTRSPVGWTRAIGPTREHPTWMDDQLLTAEQGLRAVTVDAAHALGDEARRGHLAPGTLGDVTDPER